MRRNAPASAKKREVDLVQRDLQRRGVLYRTEDVPGEIRMWIGNATEHIAYDSVTGQRKRLPAPEKKQDDFPPEEEEFRLC